VFETFPFPQDVENAEVLDAGRTYFEFRAELMRSTREGMTDTYARFDRSDGQSNSIAELRRLHDVMDRAVLDAYGWNEIQATPALEREWIDEDRDGPWRYRWPEPVRDEVLARLLALNAERAADEARCGLTVQRAEAVEEGSGQFELEAEGA
jgi:hypothetical protein